MPGASLPLVDCQTNTYRACSNLEGTGSGEQKCDNATKKWGSCILASCQSQFYLSGNQCLSRSCNPADPPVSCSIQNGSGLQSCKPDGSGWDPKCIPDSCQEGYKLLGGKCQFIGCNAGQKVDCNLYQAGTNNIIGGGKATCKADGLSYDQCIPSVCVAGYNLSGTSCLPMSCTPYKDDPCPITNGTGDWKCNSTGTGYGQCQLRGCNAGFHPNGGTCAPDTPCVWNGATYPVGSVLKEYLGTGGSGCNPQTPQTTCGYCFGSGSQVAFSCARETRTCTVTGWQLVTHQATRTTSCGGIVDNYASDTCSVSYFPY